MSAYRERWAALRIQKADLQHGQYYVGLCRNGHVARWDADHGVFRYWRLKYGRVFVEELHCREDEPCFDVFDALILCGTQGVKAIPLVTEQTEQIVED